MAVAAAVVVASTGKRGGEVFNLTRVIGGEISYLRRAVWWGRGAGRGGWGRRWSAVVV